VTSGLSTSEEEAAGHTVEADRLDLTVRYSSETAAINSKQYRVLLGDRIYNILSIDEMGFKHNSRKLHTQLVER
jgi:SPP1 family predicted phage head-tail adaptor